MLYSPKWSKAKKRLSDFLCETLRSRVDFQVINYRKPHDQLGRAVITVDKVEILSMCTITAAREEFYRERDIRDKSNQYDFDDVPKNRALQDQAQKILKADGIYGQYDFYFALEEYFNSPIEELLKSSDILINILCLLDRRIGKRTLLKMEKTILKEHELIQYFYKLRCDAENIKMNQFIPSGIAVKK
ncbi:SF0329 family protein [Peribacillus butanolivorans]|uniref:SF0329 family protein n=1 Tax=Peribacillus butanolivorans TaxID=421767 RepID=UPI00365D143F